MLRSRIDLLERTLRAHSIDVDTSLARTFNAQGEDPGNHHLAHDHSEHSRELAGSLSSDALLNFDCDGEARYFGMTSGRLEFNTSPSNDAPDLPLPGDSPKDAEQLRFSRFNHDTVDEKLVSNDVEDELIATYFKWEQPWAQVVDEHLFRSHRATKGRYFSSLLLNSILAIASRYSTRREIRSDPNDPKTAGIPFLEKAETLLHSELRWPSITTIQSLSILGVFYVAIGSDAAGWLHAGMAQRLALDMGLNIDHASTALSESHSLQEINLRRRIYWSIYCMDKLSAIYLGRVCTMLESQADVPLPCRDRSSVQSGNEPAADRPSILHDKLLWSLVGVCQIMEKILVALYYPKSRIKGQEVPSFISTITLDLKNWSYNLPKDLNLDIGRASQSEPAVYILHMVYHTAFILLYKSFVLKSQDSAARKTSYAAAISICTVGSKYRKTFHSFYQSPITATHCTLSAVLTLIEAFNHYWDDINIAGTKSSIEIGLTVLKELSDSWYPAKRIHQNLDKLWRSARFFSSRGHRSLASEGAVASHHRGTDRQMNGDDDKTLPATNGKGTNSASEPILTSTASHVMEPREALGQESLPMFEDFSFLDPALGDPSLSVGLDLLDNFSYLETDRLFQSDALPTDYSVFDSSNGNFPQRQ